MAFAQVQNKTATGTSNNFNFTPDAPLTVNTLVVIGLKLATGLTLSTVTDNATIPNTYATTNSQVEVQGAVNYLIYGVQITGGATAIPISFSGVGNYRATLGEYSGGQQTNASIFDVGSNGNSATGTSHSVTTFTPTAAGELIVAVDANGAGGGSYTAGTNYTLGGNMAVVGQEYRLSGITSETSPITYSVSGTWVEIAAAFKPYVAPLPSATNKGIQSLNNLQNLLRL